MNQREEIIRGEEAKHVLEHPLFADAVKAVRDGIVSTIANSAMGDEKAHNRLAIALQIVNQIERQLITHIETGQLAKLQTEDGFGTRLKAVVGL